MFAAEKSGHSDCRLVLYMVLLRTCISGVIPHHTCRDPSTVPGAMLVSGGCQTYDVSAVLGRGSFGVLEEQRLIPFDHP